MSSRIPGFYRLDPAARRHALGEATGADQSTLDVLTDGGLDVQAADLLIENVVGTYALPLGIGVNFLIDGEDVVAPMVVEEPSVVAAASNMARLTRPSGGFQTDIDPSVMIGQIQITGFDSAANCVATLEDNIESLSEQADNFLAPLHPYGGGLRGMEVRQLRYDEPGETAEDIVVVHFYVDCVDAMGANMINTVAEGIAPEIESLTGATVGLRILSNLADKRLARASVRIPPTAFHSDPAVGAQIVEGIASAYRFAYADPYRAATHNKGIMNGIDAVVLATGNDWRAIEAGAHSYAARDGQYRPLTSWKVDAEGHLNGTIELPMQLGIVGGCTRAHPTVRANLKLMNINTVKQLAKVVTVVGLAQNLGALRALSTDGIQEGHMRMHARTLAVTAGARADEVAGVVQRLSAKRDFSLASAETALAELRQQDG